METNAGTTMRPFRPIKPGEILQDELDARGWTQADLAEIIGRPVQAINEIIAGKKSITADTAATLSQALETSPEYWLNLEAAYRLDLIHEDQKTDSVISRKARLFNLVPLKELLKKKWIDINNLNDLDEAEEKVCSFLKIDSIEEKPTMAFAARSRGPAESYTPSHIAWVCQVRNEAEKIKVDSFSSSQLEKAIPELVHSSTDTNNLKHFSKRLADIGIRFVVVDHLPGTRIDGVTTWLDHKSPVLAVSLRYDRVDYFWFTVMHELAHILAGDGKETPVLDNDLVGKNAEPTNLKNAMEKLADERAAEWLIPKTDFRRFVHQVSPYFSRQFILVFAKKMNVHPAIVVGRLQHEKTIGWTHHRNLLTKVKTLLHSVRNPGE